MKWNVNEETGKFENTCDKCCAICNPLMSNFRCEGSCLLSKDITACEECKYERD